MIGPMHMVIENEGPMLVERRFFYSFPDGFSHISFKPPFLSVKNGKILQSMRCPDLVVRL